MATLRFTRDQLIEALEERRQWAATIDADRLAEHQKAEKEYLARFRAACRESSKWDYATAKQHYFTVRVTTPSGSIEYQPECPRSLVASLDRQLAQIHATRQDRFAVSEDGQWSRVHYLLTHDDSIKTEMC